MEQNRMKEAVSISAPNFRMCEFRIVGTSPYMQERFSGKALQAMRSKMEAGSTAKKGKVREARDFASDFIEAQHISTEGWNGIPASAFRNASIDACRMVGFKMTHGKMSLFVEADGFDRLDAMPLVKIISESPPERSEMAARIANGSVDIRVRPLWREWAVALRVRFDADQFTLTDVTNLLLRAGMQVGIGAGRPFSKQSTGLGFGLFTIQQKEN